MVQVLIGAPQRLDADARRSFREAALAALEELGDETPGGRLVVDLSSTTRLDSAGLGVLVAVQRRAAEKRHMVCLRGASDEIRLLLLMTRLEDRFVIEG